MKKFIPISSLKIFEPLIEDHIECCGQLNLKSMDGNLQMSPQVSKWPQECCLPNVERIDSPMREIQSVQNKWENYLNNRYADPPLAKRRTSRQEPHRHIAITGRDNSSARCHNLLNPIRSSPGRDDLQNVLSRFLRSYCNR